MTKKKRFIFTSILIHVFDEASMFPNPFTPATFALKEIVSSGLFSPGTGPLSPASFMERTRGHVTERLDVLSRSR